MQYDFLKDFTRRMKCVGLYALLYDNSSQKYIWKERGFNTLDEQLNVIFSVMLYIMEQSLKEESCTIDNITVFLDSLNEKYYKKSMSYAECSDLAKFIVNVVLSNEGRPMYFGGYDYEQQEMKKLHISYVNNRIIYDEQDVRRTSYYLTDDGYNLLLGTLEVESNLKLTIQEMIFNLHLEKQSYDKALDDVKHTRVQDMEEKHICLEDLSAVDTEKLHDLQEIDKYLARAIDEYQRILSLQLDLQVLYEEELKNVSEMSLVQRFNLHTELYERVLANPFCLERLDIFFRPLFTKAPDKVLNINQFLTLQKVRTLEEDWEEEAIEIFDATAWEEEQRRRVQEKMAKYEASLSVILAHTLAKKEIQLSELIDDLSVEERERLVPTIGIFKEIMVELLGVNVVNIAELRKERSDFILEETNDFRLQNMLLEILDKRADWEALKKLEVYRLPEAKPVLLKQADENTGILKNIRCSDVMLKAVWE